MNEPSKKQNKKRYPLIDAVRGLCITGMIAYHTLFDLASVFGSAPEALSSSVPLSLIRDFGAGLFIFISGICFHFSGHHLKRFVLLFICGLAVGLVSYLVTPETTVIFGILTFMSVSGMLLFAADGLLSRLPPKSFCVMNLLLYLLFARMNFGYSGTYSRVFFYMPRVLYKNYVTAFFGFPFEGFTSGDYFPLFPWFFVCLSGYFFYYAVKNSEKIKRLATVRVPFFPFVGRHSLIIYIAHQPIIYGVVRLIAAAEGGG